RGVAGDKVRLGGLIHATSLVVTIAAGDLMTQAQLIASETFRALEVYLVIAAIYFAVCYPVSQCLLWLERSIQAGVPLSLGRRRRLRLAQTLRPDGAQIHGPGDTPYHRGPYR